jgi:hypothetical protein
MTRNGFLLIVLLVGGLPAAAYAQEPAVSAPPTKFEITDNSFLVEEAFNQDRGIFQNIFSWARDDSGNWNASFTQECPRPASRISCRTQFLSQEAARPPISGESCSTTGCR